MKKGFAGLFLLTLLIISVSAQSLTFDVFIEGKNPTASAAGRVYNDINAAFMGAYVVSDIAETAFNYTGDENKAIEVIVDGVSKGKTDLNFITTSADSPDKNYTIKIFYVDYTPGMNNVKILFKGQERLSVNVASLLCDNNGRCDNCLVEGKNCLNHFENTLSCASDCSASGRDLHCNAESDGVCDFDCLNNEDTDCVGLESTAKGKSSILIYLAVIFIIVLIAAALIFLIWKLYGLVKNKDTTASEDRSEL